MSPSLGPLLPRRIAGVWIFGAGRFGRQALRAVGDRLSGGPASVVVVDRDPQRLEGLPATTVCADAAPWLAAQLKDDGRHPPGRDTLIIPALPIHLAAEWLKLTLAGPPHPADTPLEVPAAVVAALPNPQLFPGGGGLYVSVANWCCPADCPAPASHCPHTGKPRQPDLYAAFQRLRLDHPQGRSVVIHSRQLAPGVGGYTAHQLMAAHRRAGSAPGPLLTATICRCHGVVDYFLTASPDRGLRRDKRGAPRLDF